MAGLKPQYSGETKLTNARMDVALIFGSTREERLCEAVAMWAAEQIWNEGRYSLDIIDPAALPLPMFNQRKNDTEVTALRRRLGNADAFVVVTPEHDHGYPAALQFLIDTADVEWQAKPVAFVAYGGSSGGLRAVEQLRLAFAELHAITVRDTVSFANVRSRFDASGHLLQPHRPAVAMAAMLKQLHWWAVALHAARKNQRYGLVDDRGNTYSPARFKSRATSIGSAGSAAHSWSEAV
jgi:NAD(P)H-dependent FMN reductase